MALYEKHTWLSDPEATEYLGLKKGTLNVWRCTERYDLPYTKVGRLVRYKLSDLQSFLARNTVGAPAGELVNA